MFFEPRPEPPESPPEPRRRTAPWLSRPEGRMLAGVPVELVLGRTGTVAVTLSRLAACEDGFEAELAMFTTEDVEDFELPWGPPMRRRGHEEIDGPLRFGVRYPDGSKAELDAPWSSPGGRPEGPVIRPNGGSGGGGEWRQDLWFWPLPPPGAIAFALEWRAQGIELQVHELDSAPLREAAARSLVLFEPEELAELDGGHVLGELHLYEADEEG